MNTSFYELDFRKALLAEMVSNHIKELGDSSPFFAQMAKEYPTAGSRIDWGRVPDSIERNEDDGSFQVEQFISFFDELVVKIGLNGDVVYVGDSATDFALTGSVEHMRAALPKLLAIPQHHYLIGPEYSWCICFTMEGDMGFGFHPSYMKGH